MLQFVAARWGVGGEEGFEAKCQRRKLWSDRIDLRWLIHHPSSVAQVSGGGAVAASHLYAWWWGFRRRCVLSLMSLIKWGFFFFRLGKVSNFRFCFYLLMIEADAYLNFVLGFAVLVGWFFFFFWEYVWVGHVGYLFRIEVRLFFWACSVTNFYFLFFIFL